MTSFKIAENNVTLIETGASLYATGSRAKLEGMAALVIATQDERIASLAVPAKNRPKAKDIQTAIRLAFGGNCKDTDRGRYEMASLAFRVLSKLDKEHSGVIQKAVQNRNVSDLTDEIALLAGRATEDGVKAWVSPAAKETVKKKPVEMVSEYLKKRNEELSFDDLNSIANQIQEELAERIRIRDEIADRNEETETVAA